MMDRRRCRICSRSRFGDSTLCRFHYMEMAHRHLSEKQELNDGKPFIYRRLEDQKETWSAYEPLLGGFEIVIGRQDGFNASSTFDAELKGAPRGSLFGYSKDEADEYYRWMRKRGWIEER